MGRVTLALGFALAASPARAEVTTFPVRFVVAAVDGAPVVDRPWIERQLARANELFAPAAVAFALEDVVVAPGVTADLMTRADRHRLADRVDPALVHVFVVRTLADVDVEGRVIRGVHWRSRRGGPRHYCVLAAYAGEYVLAHELGHFFGNPHSPTPGNIMSYEAGDGPPFFDAAQLRRVRITARRFVGGLGPYPPLVARRQ